MDHFFDSKIVKGKKERQCFGCYSKIAIGESQEVRRGVYGGEFIEDRVCMKCSCLITKHRKRITDDGFMNRGVIQELMGELGVKTHEELDIYFDAK